MMSMPNFIAMFLKSRKILVNPDSQLFSVYRDFEIRPFILHFHSIFLNFK